MKPVVAAVVVVATGCGEAKRDWSAAFRRFLRHRSTLMPFRRRSAVVSSRPLSFRQWRRPDSPQHVAEQAAGQMPFRQQDPVIPRMLD